jgi:hypothetical protein
MFYIRWLNASRICGITIKWNETADVVASLSYSPMCRSCIPGRSVVSSGASFPLELPLQHRPCLDPYACVPCALQGRRDHLPSSGGGQLLTGPNTVLDPLSRLSGAVHSDIDPCVGPPMTRQRPRRLLPFGAPDTPLRPPSHLGRISISVDTMSSVSGRPSSHFRRFSIR